MTNADGEPILLRHFESSARVLLAEYERSKELHAAVNLGESREYFLKHFLSAHCPRNLEIGSGEVWDARGLRTGALDVVLYRMAVPVLDIGGKSVYLFEGVFAALEVKSTLNSAKLDEAIEQMALVKTMGERSSAAVGLGRRVLRRPLRLLFAYDGVTFPTILKGLERLDATDMFDCISILKRGALVPNGPLFVLKGSDEPFITVETPAAALGVLFYYIVNYACPFVAETISLDPYFASWPSGLEMRETGSPSIPLGGQCGGWDWAACKAPEEGIPRGGLPAASGQGCPSSGSPRLPLAMDPRLE